MDRQEFHNFFTENPIPIQNEDELYWLCEKIRERVKPLETIIEIGVSGGGTFKFWRDSIPVKGLLIGVDIQDYHWNFPDKDREVYFVIGASENPETVDKVKKILNGKLADFLFIDGHHDWENVYADYTNYSTLVRKGGAIGFHDCNTKWVEKLFESLQGEKEKIIISHGIGLFYV